MFPVVFKLDGKKVLVVGGGSVAARKVAALNAAGATVTVVSPKICDEIVTAATSDKISIVRRPYALCDVNGYYLVFAATSDRAVNTLVSSEARAAGIPVNVADDPELCDFFIPSSFSRGDLLVSVTTGGVCPAFSRRMRIEIEEHVTEHASILINAVARLRTHLMTTVHDNEERKRILEQVLYSDDFKSAMSSADPSGFVKYVEEYYKRNLLTREDISLTSE